MSFCVPTQVLCVVKDCGSALPSAQLNSNGQMDSENGVTTKVTRINESFNVGEQSNGGETTRPIMTVADRRRWIGHS